MSSKIISVLTLAVLAVTLLSGCAAISAHHRALFGGHRSQINDPITGEWSFTGYDHGRALPARLKFKLEGTTVTGTAFADHTGEGTIRDGKWMNGKLSFAIDFKQHKSLIVEGTLKDGKLAGECHHPDGPIYKWEATPVIKSDDLITGEWNVTFYVHEMKTPATFSFNLNGLTVTGTAYSDHTGMGTIRDGKFVENQLNFTLDFKQHQSIVVKGVLKDGKLRGEFSTEGFTDKWEAAKK